MALPALSLFGRSLAAAALLVVLALSPAQAQSRSAKDALGVPGPIAFEGKSYGLAWAAQPSPGYYKQEYLAPGQKQGAQTDMFMLEAITGKLSIQDAVAAQIGKLQQRKGTDPVVNFQVVRNDKSGEVILDFLISDRSSGTLIVEWNAYRYTKLGEGVALFAISRRGYGEEEVKKFLTGLQRWRPAAINALAKFSAPAVTPRG